MNSCVEEFNHLQIGFYDEIQNMKLGKKGKYLPGIHVCFTISLATKRIQYSTVISSYPWGIHFRTPSGYLKQHVLSSQVAGCLKARTLSLFIHVAFNKVLANSRY